MLVCIMGTGLLVCGVGGCLPLILLITVECAVVGCRYNSNGEVGRSVLEAEETGVR